MAVDTIFLCFCEDSDRNDGVERPYYMSTGLMVRVKLRRIGTTQCSCVSRSVFKTAFSLFFQQFLSDSEAALKAEKERKYAKRASFTAIIIENHERIYSS